MTRVVHLHVGAPKTGTTYLQSRLASNRAQLAEHGVDYPLGTDDSMFRPAVDLIDRPWGGMRERARGEWDALVERVHRCGNRVVISHEILAAATPQQVERVMAGLEGTEVHLVYSIRDLARQIPSEWQEGVKHWHLPTFERFLDIVREAPREASPLWFWRVQGLPDVLGRWADGLPPSRVHVVTVPPPGADRDLLWRRYCTALGIDPDWAPKEPTRRENASLGTAEATLVRRLNRRLEDSMSVDEATYTRLVRQLVVQQSLAHRPDTVPVTLPPRAYDWVDEVAEEWLAYLGSSGFDVIGDPGDLRPARPPADSPWADPDRPGAGKVLDAALETIEVLLVEAARRPAAPTTARPPRIAGIARQVRGRLRRLLRATSPPVPAAGSRTP